MGIERIGYLLCEVPTILNHQKWAPSEWKKRRITRDCIADRQTDRSAVRISGKTVYNTTEVVTEKKHRQLAALLYAAHIVQDVAPMPVNPSARSPFVSLLSRSAQSGRWSSFGKRVWFTKSHIDLVISFLLVVLFTRSILDIKQWSAISSRSFLGNWHSHLSVLPPTPHSYATDFALDCYRPLSAANVFPFKSLPSCLPPPYATTVRDSLRTGLLPSAVRC